MITEMIPRLPTKKYQYIRETRDTIAAVAAEVMAEKRNVMNKGLEGGKDLMSLLLRANAKEDKKSRMSDEEINAEIMWVQYLQGFISTTHVRARSTITFAGRTFHVPAENSSYLTVLSHRQHYRMHSRVRPLGTSQES
jgi:hypothetical protein